MKEFNFSHSKKHSQIKLKAFKVSSPLGSSSISWKQKLVTYDISSTLKNLKNFTFFLNRYTLSTQCTPLYRIFSKHLQIVSVLFPKIPTEYRS